MKTKLQNFEVLIPDLDGTAVADRVSVRVPVRWDEELEKWLLTPEAHEIIDNTKARHMGLLLPHQFRELRERHASTQREMGELFQVGEKSWNRWETGRHRPSRSINLLIRALYDSEISINYLLKRAGKPPREEAHWSYASLCSRLLGATERAAQHQDLIYPAGEGRFVLQVKYPHGNLFTNTSLRFNQVPACQQPPATPSETELRRRFGESTPRLA